MKKVVNILISFVFLMTTFCVPEVTHAKTLGDLKDELSEKQKEYEESEKEKQLTEQEIAQTNADIATIKSSISQIYVDMANLEQEIDNLYEQIRTKKTEVKQILNFLQVSNGESAYLEYIFGAESFTDLIYRSAVAEQLTRYNEELVTEYNNLIDESKKKQDELQQKQSDLANYQQELEEKAASLNETLETQSSTSLSIADEIKLQKEVIQTYIDKGCKDNENLSTCGKSTLPPGTAFYRPTTYGYIISEQGTRLLGGSYSWHEGTDIAVSEGTPVYAVANGVVKAIRLPASYTSQIYPDNCGGNMVIVHHNINGKTYTTVYAHLLSISVSSGQTVTPNTIIGYSGGSSTKVYDPCTTGAHLHLTVATGLYLVDYSGFSTELNKKYNINSRTVINYPSGQNRWYDRTTAY